MKKVYPKKMNIKKKVPMNQQDKNRIYAYLLLAAFAIWTICSILGTIAFFRTQRSASFDVVTANAEEVSSESVQSVSSVSSSRLFDLADNANWQILGTDVQIQKAITNPYNSDGLLDFSALYTSLFSSDLDITQNYGLNSVHFTFSSNVNVSIADLLFNIAVNYSVSNPTQVLKDLYVTYSNGQGAIYPYTVTRTKPPFRLYHPSPDDFRFNDTMTIVAISFSFLTTDYFHQSSMILYPLNSAGSYYTGYENGYADAYDDGYEHGYTNGKFDGYNEGESAGYDSGFNDGQREYKEEIALLKNGVFGLSYRNIATAPDGSSNRNFIPVVHPGGIFDVSKTFKNTFPEYNSSSFQDGAISFLFNFNTNEIQLSDLALNFTLNTDYLSNLDLFENFGDCTVVLSDDSVYNCPAVWEEVIDNTSMGYYDFSSLPDFNGRYLAGLVFNFYSTVYLKNYSYTIVDVNGYYAIGYDAGYELGYSAGVGSLREQLILEYGKGYEQGENVGYNNGYNDGATAAHKFTFDSLLSSVIDVPINAFTSLFNFEILGVNLANFFFALLTIMLIMAVIKFIL